MTAYYITILLVIIFSMYANLHVRKKKNINGESIYFVPRVYLFPLIAVFFIVGGLRFGIGADFYSYYLGYQAEIGEIISKVVTFDEPLIYIITKLSRQIWDNNQFVIFVENAICVLLLFKAFKEFEEYKYLMPLLLYMFYGGWLFSFNGVRQAIATLIIFAFSNDKGRHPTIKLFVAIIVASLFHKSALLMLPISLFARRKIDICQIIIILGLGFVISKLGDTFYFYMNATVETVGSYATNSINILRILVAIVPVLFIVLLWVTGSREFLNDNRIIVNMTIINAVICVCTGSSTYMNRMSYYTVIYSIFLIPKLGRIFGNTKWIFDCATIILFFVFFLYEARGYLYVWCL